VGLGLDLEANPFCLEAKLGCGVVQGVGGALALRGLRLVVLEA